MPGASRIRCAKVRSARIKFHLGDVASPAAVELLPSAELAGVPGVVDENLDELRRGYVDDGHNQHDSASVVRWGDHWAKRTAA